MGGRLPGEERTVGMWFRGALMFKGTVFAAGSQNPGRPRSPAPWGPSPGETVDSPGGGGLQHQRPAAVARDERPGVGLLADGQAGWVEAWGGGGEITICEGCQV